MRPPWEAAKELRRTSELGARMEPVLVLGQFNTQYRNKVVVLQKQEAECLDSGLFVKLGRSQEERTGARRREPGGTTIVGKTVSLTSPELSLPLLASAGVLRDDLEKPLLTPEELLPTLEKGLSPTSRSPTEGRTTPDLAPSFGSWS